MKTLKEIMNTALRTEEEGARFYRETAHKAQNHLVSATFEFLSHEEDAHVKTFKKFLADEHLSDLPSTAHEKKHARDSIHTIFSKKSKSTFKNLTAGDIDRTRVYETAMRIEQTSYDLYKSSMNEVTGEKEKKFLAFLCGQESEHFQILQDSKEFLDNPGDWFALEERWMQI